MFAMLLAAAPADADPQPREAQVLTVPGFADFLAVDGDSVWATNKGRVERWSRGGKLAEVAMSHPCGAMAIAAGSLWVADCKEGTLNRIDLKTAKLLAAIPTGIANPKGELNVVAGAGSIWVASDDAGKVARVDPADNHVVASIVVDPGTYYLAFGFDAVWAVSSGQQSLQRIDPATNQVTGRTKLGKQPGFLAAGEGAVWVQEQGDGTLARIDPATVEVSGHVKVGADLLYGDIDTGGGMVWLRTTADQTFVTIDPKTLAILGRLGKPSGSGALRFAGTGVWTSAHDVHTLSWWSLAPASGETAR
ncbi:Vgb family protein [Sphingomonas trueperi]|uniref:Vgb family protein n=1 Tax=Sphingomonas trueperi TaxID=53317 RepID=UPI000F1E0628